MTKVQKIRDPKTGRFQTTTDTTKYKMVQFNNQRMSAHAREMCIALNIQKIPKGMIVHHIDENKRNNDIHNLAVMSITAHNRIHAHEPWNKGMDKGKNIKWDNTLVKIRESREKFYLNKFKKANDLYKQGKTHQEIAEIMGVKRTTIGLRIKRYKELKSKYE